METGKNAENDKSLYRCATQWCIIRTSIKTALFVGTVLALINHYQDIFAWKLSNSELIQIGLSYLVPFLVATYAAAKQVKRTKQL